MSNDQVGDDFALALELGRFGREALSLIQRGLDLAADRYQCRKRDLGGAFKLARQGHQLTPFGFKLRVGCGGNVRMNERTCLLVRASAVRVCTVLVRGLGMALCFLCGCVLPNGAGCAVRVYTGACTPHFTQVYMRYGVFACSTVFGLGSPSSVSCTCMRVCPAVGMCSPSIVPLVVSTCMRACTAFSIYGSSGVFVAQRYTCIYLHSARCVLS